MRIEAGSEIRFHRWNEVSEDHDIFQALVREITGDKFGHPMVALSYFDESPTNQAAVRNEEYYGSSVGLEGEDYWRHVQRIRHVVKSKPYECLNPTVGNCVWYFRYNSSEGEHYAHKAVMRTKGPAPRPTVGLFWIDGDARTNESGVAPWTSLTFPTTEDHWVRRTLFPG